MNPTPHSNSLSLHAFRDVGEPHPGVIEPFDGVIEPHRDVTTPHREAMVRLADVIQSLAGSIQSFAPAGHRRRIVKNTHKTTLNPYRNFIESLDDVIESFAIVIQSLAETIESHRNVPMPLDDGPIPYRELGERGAGWMVLLGPAGVALQLFNCRLDPVGSNCGYSPDDCLAHGESPVATFSGNKVSTSVLTTHV